jgi:hypothetical protein
MESTLLNTIELDIPGNDAFIIAYGEQLITIPG